MDVVIIAGVSRNKGDQFSIHQELLLTRNGEVMTYENLRKLFGLSNPLGDNLQTPYLAGMYLYNYMTRRGLKCALINFLDLELDEFEKLAKQNPKVIVLSTTYLTSIRLVKPVTKLIRQYAQDAKLVIGGPLIHNSSLLHNLRDTEYDTDSCKQDYFFLNQDKFYREDIDIFIIDEQGEATLTEVIKRISVDQAYRSLPNLAYYENDQLVMTKREVEDNSMEEDRIDWSLMPNEYLKPVFPLRGSSGCPYKCGFCNFGPMKKFRLKVPELLSEEITDLAQTGKVKIIQFTDDNLFLDRRHAEKQFRQMIENAPGIKWSSFIRASSITPENIDLLKASGCTLAQIGIESGDRDILKAMNKRAIPEDYLQAVELLNSHGINTQLYVIIGYPGETEKTIENTISFLNEIHHEGPAVNQLLVFPFVLAPLSPVYENAKKYNLKGYLRNWEHETMNSEQAAEYSRQIYDHVHHLHPNYGTEELYFADGQKLKSIYELRSRIVEAEKNGEAKDEIQTLWGKLEQIVAS